MMEKFALVLFDLDGYTSVIERRHLITDIEPTVSKTLNVRYGRKELFGEILCLNDDKYAIDVFQEKWEKTERAKFLYKEIQKRERLGTSHTGGFLALWPGDEIEVDSNVQRVENHVPEEVAEGTEAMEVIEEASQNENQENQETSLDPESVEEVYTETVKEGLNGRKITVLYEGAGDPNGIADPQRTPVFVRDLTTDQQDILNQRLNDHRTGKSTKSVNTMDVIIVNTDEEIRELQKKPPTTDASTQTHFTTDISLLEVLLKNSTQILQLLQQLPKRKNPDQLEETNNPSLVEYLQSENIDFLMVQTPKKLNPGQQTSVLSEPVPLNSTELTDLSIQPLSTSTSSPAKSPVSPRYRGLSASPVAHPLSPLSPSPTPVCPGTPSPECSPIFPELCRRVQQTTTTFNSTQIQPSVPSQPFTILNHPIQHFSHPSNLIYNQLYTEPAPSFSSRTSCRPTTECFSAPITEISSNTAPIGNNEIRIAQDVQWEIKNAAQNNTGSFGWKMTRRIFKKEELRGKNFYGRKGKAGLSPRRRHAIEHAILDTYGSNSALTQAVTAINTGIRNLHR